MRHTIGFLGTGNIAAAIVTGLCRHGDPPDILVSPRSAAKAKALAQQFSAVTVAPDNAAVVANSDIVWICLRPQVAAGILADLAFRPDQRIVSLVPLLTLADLVSLVAPAAAVVRAVPLPPAARGLGAVPYFPPHTFAEALIARIGQPLAVQDESQFHRLWTVTAMIAPFYALMGAVSHWAVAGGVAPQTAEDYTAAMFKTLAVLAEKGDPGRFERLADEGATPGGLNEQAVEWLRANGVYVVGDALDAVLKRFPATDA